MPLTDAGTSLFTRHLARHNFRQMCEIATSSYYDENGQAVYDDRRAVRCRIEYITVRTPGPRGDVVSAKGVKVFLPADDPVKAEDRIFLPTEYAKFGPIISSVEQATNIFGRPGSKVVTVL